MEQNTRQSAMSAMSQLFSGRDIERERSEVHEQIEKNKADLVAAEVAIKRLHADSVDLNRRLNKATSFINNLPEDILVELFIEICDENNISMWGKPPHQFLIGSVCHQWREVAWRTHKLWRKIFICFYESRCDVQQILLEEWLERSGGYPLEIFLIRSASGRHWEPSSLAFDKILESCDRWESLTTHPFKSLLSALENGPPRHFSAMKKLFFTSTFSSEISGSGNHWKFNNPPRLEQLVLDGRLRNSTFQLDWGALLSLTAAITIDPSTAGPVSINSLFLCTSLTNLHLIFAEEDGDNDDLNIIPGALLLPQVTRLTLSLSYRSSLDPLIQFLNLITVPSLEYLHLSTMGDHEQDGEWADPLIHLAHRSGFKLSSLSLNLTDFTDSHLMSVIQHLSPSNPIQSLRINSDSLPNTFRLSNRLMSQFITNPEDSPERRKQCLPMLSDFYYSGDISCSLDTLARFWKSRLANSEDRVDAGPLDIKLSIDIRYSNRGWLGKQNPNAVQAFYRDVEELSDKGIVFKLIWESHHGNLDADEFDSDDD